jgi:hypothetical protein
MTQDFTVLPIEPQAPLVPERSTLPGINVLLEGATGTGKTHALGTMVDAGVECFALFTESGLETLLGYWRDRNLPVPDNIHWHELARPKGSFDVLARTANDINTLSQEALYKMSDPNRGKQNQFTEMLRVMGNYVDQRTGQSFGAVDSWGPDRALLLDSLSGINPIAMSLVVGGKPVRSQADWGIAQQQIENLVRLLCDGCRCHFVMTAHVEREVDQVFGGVKVTVATLGRALAPKIPPLFSDVVLTLREGTKFSWSTANPQADLKARNLPIADGIPPSFKVMLDKWQQRGGRFTP